jgi:hypothetical protein
VYAIRPAKTNISKGLHPTARNPGDISMGRVVVFNATFNNISAISRRSV